MFVFLGIVSRLLTDINCTALVPAQHLVIDENVLQSLLVPAQHLLIDKIVLHPLLVYVY